MTGVRDGTAARAEGLRKAIHVLLALAVLPMPLLDPPTALVVAGAVALGVAALAVRATSWPPILAAGLQRVGRQSVGELAFFGCVPLLYHLHRLGWADWYGGMIVLAIADPLAALVGARWGRRRLPLRGAVRSVAGTLTCLAAATGGALVVGAASGDVVGLVIVALAAGAAATLAEAVTPYGLDNVTAPLAAAVVIGTGAGPVPVLVLAIALPALGLLIAVAEPPRS